MRVLSSAPCTVRSTVLVVAVVAASFIVLDSYTWKLLPIGRPRPTSATFGPSGPKESYEQVVSAAASHELPSSVPSNDSAAGAGTPLQPGRESPRAQNSSELESKSDLSSVESGSAGFPPGNMEAPDFKDAGTETSRTAVTPDGFATNATHGNETVSSSTAAAVLQHGSPVEIKATPQIAAPVGKKPPRRYDELSSLQKVELDLWQARAAMRRVVLSQMNSSNATGDHRSVVDGEPSGDVYRNAAIFRQSYQEMERRFKVYTYQEGEEPLVHNGPCKEIYAVEGRFIQELKDENPFVTSDPEAAHVFFLPFSVSMMVTYLYTPNSRDMSPLLRFVKDYVNVVAHKYPFWRRSEGADHFMLSCHDWGPHVSRADHNLVSKTIRVLCNANVSEGYVPTKDASLPEIHLVGGRLSAALGGLPASERTSLAFFAGADHGPVRPALFKHWEGKAGDIHVFHQVPAKGKSYHDYMKSSKYCLCPGGYEVNSPRIVEAIYNECVPVVIADHFVLPFSDVLDWKTFAVHIQEKDIPHLKFILEAIPRETYIRMQAKVKLVQPHFVMNQPPKRYDVFHMILHSVWLRRLNIRILE